MKKQLFAAVSLGVLLFAGPLAAQTASIQLTQDPRGPFTVDGNNNNNLNLGRAQLTYQGITLGGLYGFKNLLDNGAMGVQQRGTGTATAASTAGCVALSYAADRWCADVNVTSGAGQLTPITATPAPPAGFQASLKLVRNSGALTQPQCVWQEINTSRVVPVAGQFVMLSGYIAASAGLNTDNGNAVSMVIITGTGTDEGLGALRSAVGMTTSPAITPAWTGVATLQTTALTVTTSFVRYNGAAVLVPATATEMAVGFCFTPTASGAGATDGFAFTGAQLEVTGQGATGPTQFDARPQVFEQVSAQQKYFQQAELNGFEFGAGACQATNTPKVPFALPVAMDVAPVGAWTAGGFSLNIAGAGAAAASGGNILASGGTSWINLAFTNTCTAGGTIALVGTNTTGKFTLSADF